jgi:hypothetical protein
VCPSLRLFDGFTVKPRYCVARAIVQGAQVDQVAPLAIRRETLHDHSPIPVADGERARLHNHDSTERRLPVALRADGS